MKPRFLALAAALCFTVAAVESAQAGGGLFGLDHLVTKDDHGIWARKNQMLLFNAMLVGEGVAAVWAGGESRFGRTMWKSIDATLVSGVAAQGLKFAFSRARPNESPDPNQWFQGSGHASFPSGEATLTSAIVTPIILEYRDDHPLVYALAVLPLYDAVARVKTRGHWQSDVIAGLALGTTTGYFMHHRSRTPIVLSVMPQGIYVGLGKRF
jgi:undecaprenyl-diphosphatase